VRAAELVMLAAVRQSVQSSDGQIAGGEALHTFLTFAKPLAYSYRRGTVIVYGNVAPATHGETRREILGSGNSAVGLQTFTLKQPPLTLVPAATPSGAASTLVVRVNDVQWHEAAGLSYLGPTDRSFLTGVADDGPAAGTSVTFGTGKRGARLPTGVENVRAVYRSGIGSPGNVKPEQISQLATRPLGITEVTNPIRSSGGADPESRESARANVPLAVAALDRLVSVPDYADFARTFAGVGKAAAARLTDGVRQLIQVTIAGAEDIPIDAGSDLYRNLAAALHLYGDPYQPLRLAVRELLPLVLSLNIKVSPDYAWDTVERHVRAALLERFGFDRRDLGEDLPTSTVISAAAGVRGVDYVDLDVITVLSEVDLIRGLADLFATPPPARTIPRRITAAGDRFESGVLKPAQLITLLPGVPDSLILNEMKR
jgi:predicted phage baseplate assembly protein